MLKFTPLFLAVLLFYSCNKSKEIPSTENQLGVLNHEFIINDAAKVDFEHGLLLLHSFEYDDALTAFQAAKTKDSTEIMAYWGEAMSYYKALWGLQDKRAGYQVMEKLGITQEERIGKISDPLEKDFWLGLEILYGDGTLKERNSKFSTYMAELYAKHPQNQEVAAFYALSMLWDSDDEATYVERGKKSAMITDGILKENPLHPGALHYTIHAYDDPHMANFGMESANNYSKVAPSASHALHMPSHIYLALGMWNEVVKSNEVSYQASVDRMNNLNLDDAARGYHPYAWLHYAYLQQGRVEDAKNLLAKMSEFYKNTQIKGIRSYIASMQCAFLFETGNWPEDLEPIVIKTSDLGLGSVCNTLAFDAYRLMKSKDANAIQLKIDTLTNEIKKAELYVTADAKKMCSSGPSRYAPDKDALVKANVILNELYAYKAMAEEDENLEQFLKEAVKLEKDSEYSSGPADVVFPSFELYGEWLLSKERYEEALDQFSTSLDRAPNRRKALLGKKAALQALDKKDLANEIDKILSGFSPKDNLAKI